MSRLIFASTNPAKPAALAQHLRSEIALEPLSAAIATKHGDAPCEDDASFTEIAGAKAAWWSRHLPGELVLASDGGLLIPALGDDWDPLRTARFAADDHSGRSRAEAVISLAADLRGADRTVTWTESLAVARSGRVLASWTESGPPGFLAESAPPEASRDGFWVPSIWLCPEFAMRRLADLTPEEALQRNDHWSHLARRLEQWLRANESP